MKIILLLILFCKALIYLYVLSVIRELVFFLSNARVLTNLKPYSNKVIVLYCTTLLYCTVLYCAVLCRTALHCTVLHCTILYCTVLFCTALYCIALYCTDLYCTALHCTVLFCSVLYCTIRYCIVLYCLLYCTACMIDTATKVTQKPRFSWRSLKLVRCCHLVSKSSAYFTQFEKLKIFLSIYTWKHIRNVTYLDVLSLTI